MSPGAFYSSTVTDSARRCRLVTGARELFAEVVLFGQPTYPVGAEALTVGPSRSLSVSGLRLLRPVPPSYLGNASLKAPAPRPPSGRISGPFPSDAVFRPPSPVTSVRRDSASSGSTGSHANGGPPREVPDCRPVCQTVRTGPEEKNQATRRVLRPLTYGSYADEGILNANPAVSLPGIEVLGEDHRARRVLGAGKNKGVPKRHLPED